MKTDARFLGALTVSMLRGMEGNQRKEVLRLCDWLTRDIQPTHLLLTNMLIAGCLPEFKQRTQARTFVTIQGDDIFLESLPEPYQQQSLTAIRSLIPWVDGFLFHSRDYADRMSRWMAIPQEKITIIPLGIELQDFQQRPSSRIEGPYRIGYLARMAPEKGLDLVVDAFIGLRKRNPECTATLEMAGWMGPQHQDFWNQQQRKLDEAGLAGQWTYHGSVDRREKISFLDRIDLLCVPTRYQEPKGLFVLEAAAAGVPYLLPAHGAFPETHQRLQHGQLVPPLDANALIHGLEQAMQSGPISIQERNAQRDRLQRIISIEAHTAKVIEKLEARS
ncbi:MAG: glycosyltransferase family 4 protein [Pirellulales bacterium]